MNSKTIGIKCPVCLTGRIIDASKKQIKIKLLFIIPKKWIGQNGLLNALSVKIKLDLVLEIKN